MRGICQSAGGGWLDAVVAGWGSGESGALLSSIRFSQLVHMAKVREVAVAATGVRDSGKLQAGHSVSGFDINVDKSNGNMKMLAFGSFLLLEMGSQVRRGHKVCFYCLRG